MAFEQPLEADQIDLESSDFNIFSAFVRVPLLILGGVLGGGGGSSSNNADGDDDKENSDDASFSSSITPSVHRLISNIDEDDDDDDDDGDPRTSGVFKDLTSMNIHDDDERFFDCNGSSSSSCSMSTATTVRVFSDETMEQQQQQQLNGNFKHDDNDGNRNNLVVVTKKMSWSDESGLRLVQYNDESVLHEPSPYADACKPQPMKSALRRTKSNGYCTMSSGGGHHDLLSVSRGSTCATDSDSTTASSVVTATRSPSTSPRPLAATAKTAPIPAAPATAAACPVPSAQQQQKPRYLPNMQPAGKSLLVPTRPFGHPGFPHHQHRQSDPGPNGTAAAATAAAAAEMSPQWGWYINTTPPTPEMYHSSSTLGGPGSGYPPHKMLTGATFPHQLAAANAATGRGGTAGAGSTTNVKPRLSSAAAGGGTVHNPVFQHLQQANNQHNNMGWTPVPI